MRDDQLLALIAVFVPFSFMLIGGGSAILAGVQHESVVVHRWVTSQDFIHLFAISRAAPGPGTMLATLVGWKVGGWVGAIVATVALIGPSSLLFYTVLKLTNSHREKKWHKITREGLAPVGVGLIIAGCVTIFRFSGGGMLAAAIAVISTTILLWRPRFPVLGILFFGALTTTLAGWLPG